MTKNERELRFNDKCRIMNDKCKFFIFCLFFISIYSHSQLSFSFLNIPNNAKINALGGMNVSAVGADVNMIATNPALLDTADAREGGISYSPYLAQSHFLNLNYTKNGRWAFQLQNLNFGTFQGTDDSGNLIQNFSANDFFIGVTHSRKIENFSFGITAKLIGSFLESYNSSAIGFDFGGIFKHPKKDLSIGLVAKNIGFILSNYSIQKNSLPFDLQAGITFKPQFMPVRFSFMGHHLHQFDIAYQNPQIDFDFDENGNKIIRKVQFLDKLFRHTVFGSEFLIHKHFNLLLGYNHLRRKEHQLNQLGSLAGISFGANLLLKKFNFAISHARFTRAGSTIISLSYKFHQFTY